MPVMLFITSVMAYSPDADPAKYFSRLAEY